jgi:hypothetical protein
MKLSIGVIRDMLEPMQRLGKERLPVKVAYWLGKDTDTVLKIARSYEDRRNELIKSLGTERRLGYFEVLPENFEQFGKAMSELRGIEEEIDLHPIKIEMLEASDLKVQVTAEDMRALEVILIL